MVDFEKSTRILEELEENANDLKKFSEVYKKLGEFQGRVDGTRQLLDRFAGDTIKIVKDVTAKNEGLTINLQKLINSVHSNLDRLTIENSDNQKIIKSLLETHTQEILDNSHKFQRELDSALFSRLERHKSDIEVEIRGQLVQVERVLSSTLSTAFNSMETKVTDKILLLEKKIFTLTLISSASLFSVFVLAFMLFK